MTFKLGNEVRTILESDTDSISVRLAGHFGGIQTLRRRGRNHFVIAGKLGQEVFAQRYTSEDRSRWGRLGGRPRKSTKVLGEKGQIK